MKMRTVIIFLLVAGTAAGSWFYSRRVYELYTRLWYRHVAGQSEQDLVDGAEKALDAGDYVLLKTVIPRYLLSIRTMTG
jgi:hypothetical protein